LAASGPTARASPEAAFYRAQLFLRDNHPDAAVETLDRLLAGRPGFIAGYLLRAQVHLILNHPDGASRDLDKLARTPPLPRADTSCAS
jgi:hypothetical protein